MSQPRPIQWSGDGCAMPGAGSSIACSIGGDRNGRPVRDPSIAVITRAMSTQVACQPPEAITIRELPPGTGCSVPST